MDHTKNSKLILKLGFMGCIGVLITIISDLILLGKPGSAYDFLISGTETMWDISTDRITAGTFIGVVALPFQLLGLVPVYYALKPAGKVWPTVAIIPCAHAFMMGIAFHMSYAFIGSAWKLNHQADAAQMTADLMNQYDLYWTLLIVIMAVEILFFSVIYSILVAKGNTLFPRWIAFFNPMSVAAITMPIIFIIPYPVGGYIGPACLNISNLTFFVLTQVALHRKFKTALGTS